MERAPLAEPAAPPTFVWKDSLLAVAITALLLLTFVVLFTAATGTFPSWWPR